MMLLRVMVRVPLLLIGSLILAVITSPQLALILCADPGGAGCADLDHQQDFPMFGEVQRRLDKLNTVMQENLSGVAGDQGLRPRRPRARTLPRRQR